MLNDVIESYGGEKVDPLDVYKDIFRIGEGFIPVSYTHLDVYKRQDSFRRSMKIVEVLKQIQSPIIRMKMKIMAILELCLNCLLYTSRCV